MRDFPTITADAPMELLLEVANKAVRFYADQDKWLSEAEIDPGAPSYRGLCDAVFSLIVGVGGRP